jgi:hypothetical protein
MPECWLKVSLHTEGPATGQLDQGIPWFSLVLEQMLSSYPNSTLHCMLHMQPSQWQQKFHLTVALHMLDQNITIMQPFQRYIKILISKTPAQLHSFRLYTYSLSKASPSLIPLPGQAVTAWEP